MTIKFYNIYKHKFKLILCGKTLNLNVGTKALNSFHNMSLPCK